MSNWAATCNYCGAPLQGARCPRCNYERKPFGEIVYTAAESQGGGGTGAAAYPMIYTPIGTVAGINGMASIPNVTVPAGSLLVVYALGTYPIGGENQPEAVWNALSLSGQNPNAQLATTTTTNTLAVAVTATSTINISSLDAEWVVAIAYYLTPATAIDRAGHGDGSDADVVGSSGATTQFVNELLVADVFVEGAGSETGTWESSMTPRQSILVPGAIAGHLSDATKELPTVGSTVIARKTLSVPANWFMDVSSFK